VTVSPEDLDRLRTEIKSELREEMRAEIERAARDAAQERRAAQEWEEESWVEEVRPKLNFVDFDGYFRTRVDLFQRAHLGTYDPSTGKGTSAFAPPLNYSARDDRHDTIFTSNMRLRLDPTLNVSEDVRVHVTADVFDNLVFGATPQSLGTPMTFLSSGQVSPDGTNSLVADSLKIRRVWGEVNTPFGQLRFGRMGHHFGLGILNNDGNCLECDNGNDQDRLMFVTRVLGHYIIPSWDFTSSGPWGRGGGPGGTPPATFLASERGQAVNLDPRDDVHTWSLTVARRDSPTDIREKLALDSFVINYGFYGAYRLQYWDNPTWNLNPLKQATDGGMVSRGAWAAMGSLWGLFQWRKLKIEGELSGIYGHIGNVQGATGGKNDDISYLQDGKPKAMHCYVFPGLDSFTKRGSPKPGESGYGYKSVRFPPDPSTGFLDLGEGTCLRQLGFAVEGSYTFLNDSLVIGGGAGYASGDDAPGFGIRTWSNTNPRRGDVDGQQYGGTMPDGKRDNTIENFAFNPDYRVDMIMFREVVGTVTDAVYVKPSVTYYILDGLGVRGDAIAAVAQYASSTPGDSNLLGAEFNGHVFYRSEDGFYGGFTYAFMLPLAGFHHAKDGDRYTNVATDGDSQSRYGEAKFAQRFHAILGVQF
jgi:hypothetical protein